MGRQSFVAVNAADQVGSPGSRGERCGTDEGDWRTVTESARRFFRILTRTRSGYDGAVLYDVQLQAAATGSLLWSQTFTDAEQARTYETTLDGDLDLDDSDFRRKYSIPSSG